MAGMKTYPEHVDLKQVWNILQEHFFQLGKKRTVEWLPVLETQGMRLGEDLFSKRNVPHFPASAVDGYAVKAESTAGASRATPVSLSRQEYQWVNTGSFVPHPFDGVVMVEDTSLDDGKEFLKIYKAIPLGWNIRPVGEDVMKGQILARKYEDITPAMVSLFLMAGLSEIPVFRKPRTVFIPTGDEMISQERWLRDSAPAVGTGCESNSAFLAATFALWGLPFSTHAIVPDDRESLRVALLNVIKDYDLVLWGAGSAKGERDYTAEILEDEGRMLFRWLRMRPARPAMAAIVRGKPVIGMPGFPASTAVVTWGIVYPLLKLLQGEPLEDSKTIEEAILAKEKLQMKLLLPHSSPQGMEEWLRVKCAKIDGEKYAWSLSSGASNVGALADADGLVILSQEVLELPKESPVEVLITRSVDWGKRALFQGSDDPAIQRLVTPIRERGGDLVLRTVGSLGGLAALARGEGHIAACHLLNPADGSYNDKYIEEMAHGKRWVRKLVFYRRQGLLVPHGNPDGVAGFEDIAKKGLRFVNRQPGAGTRVLLDFLLEKAGIDPVKIIGYTIQCVSHLEAANRVATGMADVTLGIKAAADAMGLDFIPLSEEPYELVIPETYLEHPGVRALLLSLEDEEWRRTVEHMGGYRWPI